MVWTKITVAYCSVTVDASLRDEVEGIKSYGSLNFMKFQYDPVLENIYIWKFCFGLTCVKIFYKGPWLKVNVVKYHFSP